MDNPDFLERAESAEIVLQPTELIYLETFDSCPGLGRIAVAPPQLVLGNVLHERVVPFVHDLADDLLLGLWA
jgi:hypothetical protein